MNDNQSPLIGLLMLAGLLMLLANPQGCQQTPTVTTGPRTILLVRETSNVTPEMARTEVQLRAGPAAEYLTSKSHRLWILSDDQGPPMSLSQAAKEAFTQSKSKLPAVVVVSDQSGGQSTLWGVEQIAPTATADDVLAVVKKYGG